MTLAVFYAALKFWLPIITAFTMVYKAYGSAKTGITAWADKLLNNHLSHIQSATEETANLMRESIQADSKYREQDARVQQEIITGIEILRDRL